MPRSSMVQRPNARAVVALVVAALLLGWSTGVSASGSVEPDEAGHWLGAAIAEGVVEDARRAILVRRVSEQPEVEVDQFPDYQMSKSSLVASTKGVDGAGWYQRFREQCFGADVRPRGHYRVAVVSGDTAGWLDALAEMTEIGQLEARPVVRLVFDAETEEWDYGLGGRWAGDDQVRRHFAERFTTYSVETREESLAERICAVVGSFESFIERAGDDAEGYFAGQRAERTANLVRRKLQGSLGDVRRHADFPVPEGSRLFQQDFKPALDEATEYLREVREHLEEDRLREALEAAEQASESADEVQEVTDVVEEARKAYFELNAQADDVGIRSISVLPHGSRVAPEYRRCRKALDRLEHQLEEVESLDRIEEEFDEARGCFDELEVLLEETETSFWVWTVGAPLGGLVVVVAGLTAVTIRRRREMLEIEADGADLLNEWGERVPELVAETEQLVEEFPACFARSDSGESVQLDEETREIVDHCFVLADRADELLGEAERIFDDLQRDDDQKDRELKELLQKGESTLRPERSGRSTRIQDELSESHTHAHVDLLDDLERLVATARRRLRERGGSGKITG